ncbi:hypothetical protein J6590_026517 [Homalodisca vitripennis]|nr:hypothetical protein J6590_026517 [Homalodisca vitripennis]
MEFCHHTRWWQVVHDVSTFIDIMTGCELQLRYSRNVPHETHEVDTHQRPLMRQENVPPRRQTPDTNSEVVDLGIFGYRPMTSDFGPKLRHRRFNLVLSVTLVLFIITIDLLQPTRSLICLISSSHKPLAPEDGQIKAYRRIDLSFLLKKINIGAPSSQAANRALLFVRAKAVNLHYCCPHVNWSLHVMAEVGGASLSTLGEFTIILSKGLDTRDKILELGAGEVEVRATTPGGLESGLATVWTSPTWGVSRVEVERERGFELGTGTKTSGRHVLQSSRGRRINDPRHSCLLSQYV